MWYVRPAKPQIEYSMIVKLLTVHHLEFLSLIGGCTGLSESIHVKCHIVGNHMLKCHIVGNHMSRFNCFDSFLASGDFCLCYQFGPRSGRQYVNPDLNPNQLTLIVFVSERHF